MSENSPATSQEATKPGWKKQTVIFLTGQTISTFGSFLVQYAIFWHLTLTTKSGLVLALASIFGFLPQAIVSIFGGVWADRVNRKWMIVIADASIAIATFVLALLMLLGSEELWLIFLVMAVRSVGAGFQMPAISALLPQLVPTEQLLRVNGINSSVQSSLTILAPVAAAAVYSTMSLVGILFIDVLTAVIGIVLLLTIKVPSLPRMETGERPSYFADLKEGIAYIFTHKLVRWVMAVFAVVFLLIVAPSNLSPLMLVRNFGSEVWKLTVLELSFGIGMMLGGVLVAVLAQKLDRIKTMIGTSVIFGLLAIAMGFTTNLWLFFSLFFFVGLAVPAFSTASNTLLQQTVEPERQGRVFGFVGIVISVAMPLGMAILGPLADVVSVESLLIITGAATAVIALIAIALPSGRQAIKLAKESSAS